MTRRKSSAFVPHDLARPLAGAPQGPLAGLSVAVKDMYDIAGERAGGGSPEWLAAQLPAQTHAHAVQRLLAAGATIIGKTVCDEFFYSLSGANAHYGTPINSRAPERLPGGSSSGSAAATAAGACDFALGSDTAGSVRIPAALCGVFGIRTTHGRVDSSGAMAMAPSFDTVGWFAASAGILHLVGQVLLGGRAAAAPISQLLLPSDALALADRSVADVLRAFMRRIDDVLPAPVQMRLTTDSFATWLKAFRSVQGFEIWQQYGAWITQHRPRLGPGIAQRMAFAASVSKLDADAARVLLQKIRNELRALIAPGTLLCLPTAPCIAPRIDASADQLDDYRQRVLALVCTASIAGLPQVTLPVGLVEGCPVGFSLIGWAGSDEVLLDLAATLAPRCGM